MNMTTDTLYTKATARTQIIKGIQRCAEAVGGTMGTSGANVILEAVENPGHMVTNDGATILERIKFSDPLEEMGRKVLLEAVSRANKKSGDGSSTTCVLTSAIIQEGLKHVDEISPMELNRQLNECATLAEKYIREHSQEVTVDTVGDVATISAEDAAIGALIQEIYQQIGPTGIIEWDVSKTTEDSYTVSNGLTMEDAKAISPYLSDIDSNGRFKIDSKFVNPVVIITTQKITSPLDIDSITEQIYKDGKREVLLFCDEIEPTVIPSLVETRKVTGMRIFPVKMPVLWRNQWYEDLALASGATVIDQQMGLTLQDMTLEHLGTFSHVHMTAEEVNIEGIKDMSEHIAKLKEENTDDSLLRASRLNTRHARLFVGAESDSALSYKRLKVEDAIAAAWNALQDGVVAGGGSALVSAAQQMPLTTAGFIMREALCRPAQQIAENAHFKDEFNPANYADGHGLDSRTNTFVNMIDNKIIDPTNIVVNALKTAASVAANNLTIHAAVTLPREQDYQMNVPMI